MKITESLDRVADFTKGGRGPTYFYKFSLRPELNIDINTNILNRDDGRVIEIAFDAEGEDVFSQKNNKSTFVIFATLTEIIQKHVREHNVKKILCSSFSQTKLDIYEKLFKRFGSKWNVERNSGQIIVTRQE
jgi:ribosomal protein L20A (L18A)